MGKTKIQWTDHSINPFRARDKATGAVGHFCVKLSAGCTNCYSSRLQSRFKIHEFVAKNRDKVELFLDESKLEEVLRRKVPTRYFWCDMTDMFLEDYPDEWVDKCFAVMALTPQHTHQVLTKRAERMYRYFAGLNQRRRGHMHEYMGYFAEILNLGEDLSANPHWQATKKAYHPATPAKSIGDATAWPWPLPNVHLGVSCEDQKTANERYEWLKQTPAAVRWWSVEPMLGAIPNLPLEGISWVVCGGESGPKARPMDIAWPRDVKAQCEAAGVPFFMKQFGAKPVAFDPKHEWFEHATNQFHTGGRTYLKLVDKKGGDWSEWPSDLRVRQFPKVAMGPTR